ncbi:MAG: hypothetical protein IPP07_29120 [Holophagales bacterium]|nr:hypothetical protein [Holophagales bacterium]
MAGIAAAGGPRYEAVWIDPVEGREGGQPGGNIRVALLLNSARVTLVKRGEAGPLDGTEPEGLGKELHLTLSPGRVAPRSTAFTLAEGEGVRRSLAVELLFRGKKVFVVANHWSSKSDDDRAFGATQPPPDADEVAPTRAGARDPQFRRAPPRGRPEGPGRRPRRPERLRALGAGPALPGATARGPRPAVPTESRYTFNFDGASQVLDHVVVSPASRRRAAVEIVHVNSDCADEKRVSDHDPVVVRMLVK